MNDMDFGRSPPGAGRRQGAVQQSGLGASLRMRTVSRLNRWEITPYRTETANTFGQGPVAAGRTSLTLGNSKFAGASSPVPPGAKGKTTSLQGRDGRSFHGIDAARTAGGGDRQDLRPIAFLPGEARGLTLSPYTAPLRGLGGNGQLSRRLRALKRIRRRRASLEILRGVRCWLTMGLWRK